MSGFLLRIIINALILCAVLAKLPGFSVDTLGGAMLAAAIIGLANAAIRPLLALIEVPFNTKTVGLLAFLTNLVVLPLLIGTLPGFQVSSLLAPVAGVMLMTFCSFAVTRVIQDR